MRLFYDSEINGQYAVGKALRHMTMRVLFLDIDGVLNNQQSLKDGSAIDFTGWDPTCVEVVRQMCLQFDLQIVVSSAWRINWGDCMWNLGRAGLDQPVDRTPDIPGELVVSETEARRAIRGDEVAKWLREHPRVRGYVILDDDADFLPEQMPHLIHTNIKDGVRPMHMALVAKILAKGMP